MIISHKHKFIFIKTHKTAGTSVEIALSKYCGPQDIITPIVPEDEAKRKELGYRGPQNYRIPLRKYSALDYLTALSRRKPMAFYHHANAEYIKRHIDKDVWNSYYKFCFERNPWDKAVSWYYWKNKTEPRPTLSEFIQSGKANIIKGFNLYTINGEIIADDVFLYEELEASMAALSERIGLPETPELPRTKTKFRKGKRNYRELLSQEDRDKLAKVFAREIAYFGYSW